MIKTDLFPTPVWETSFLEIDNNKLESYAYTVYEDSGRQNRSYHSDTTERKHNNWLSENLDVRAFPELQKLTDSVYMCALAALREFNPHQSTKLKLGPVWFTINKQGEAVTPHQHPGCVLAGVYYIKASDTTGELKFINPDKAVSWNYIPHLFGDRTKYTAPFHTVKPSPHKFVMFPGNLVHFVNVNEEAEDRISIAFNFIGTQV
jgi:uncharacterized protein (TIGR02466 family)